MKHYLVTGGTGFIGSFLVKKLVLSGHKVRVLDNNIRGSLEKLGNFHKEIEFIEGDIRNPEIVHKACKNIDSVAHLAYINGTEYFYKIPETILEVALKGALNVFDACIKENVEEIIIASSSEVYQSTEIIPTHEKVPFIIPDPTNPRYSYGAGKMMTEMLALNYGKKFFKKVLIFRPYNVYGPAMGWEHVIPQFITRIHEIIKNDSKNNTLNFSIQGTGNETRAFIYIDDFIEGLMHVIERGNHLEVYNIGTMQEISIKKLAQEVAHYFKKEIIIQANPALQGSVTRRCPHTQKLQDLGFIPHISLQTGIAKTAEWYIHHYNEIQKINLSSSFSGAHNAQLS